MCMGGKSKSTAAPPPTPATTFQPMPADYSNVSQRKQAVAASTNSQTASTQGSAGLGSELGGGTANV
jgi:hypothetical protein